MPQLIVMALVGAGLYAGYRWLARTAREIAADALREEEALRQRASGALEKDMGRLEYDPATGLYTPVDRC